MALLRVCNVSAPVAQGSGRSTMAAIFELFVNGEKRRVEAPAAEPLIYSLRNRLGLKGTRYGCGLEQCGSCMVLIDGAPVTACTRAIDSVAGRAIETLEGLAEDATGQALQQAFLAEQAGQCGFCLAGILVAGSLRGNASPPEGQLLVRVGERALDRLRFTACPLRVGD